MLKNGKHEEITKTIQTLQAEARSTIKNSMKLVYFMRGAISYNEIMKMSKFERDIVGDIVEERLEQESKHMYPNY